MRAIRPITDAAMTPLYYTIPSPKIFVFSCYFFFSFGVNFVGFIDLGCDFLRVKALGFGYHVSESSLLTLIKAK